MKTNQVLKIGINELDFIIFSSYFNTTEKVRELFSQRKDPKGLRAIRLADYLVKKFKTFR